MLNYSHILFKQAAVVPARLLFLFTGAASDSAQQFKRPGSLNMRNLLLPPYSNSDNILNSSIKSDYSVTTRDGVILFYYLQNKEFLYVGFIDIGICGFTSAPFAELNYISEKIKSCC
jgi:hypothetical protein